MRNYFFYPLAHDVDIDTGCGIDTGIDISIGNSPSPSSSTPLTVTQQTHQTQQTQTEDVKEPFSFIYSIPFFNTLFYPTVVKKQSYKTLFYYQTFSSLDPIINLKLKTKADIYVYISSVHFGMVNKVAYIGINDNPPDKQGTLWDDALKAHENNVNMMLMLGGAGGAYTALFSNFEVYYGLLYELLNNKRYIKGIDLDIEESVKLADVKMFINRLKRDFGSNFIITMAPVASSLMFDMPGMGGFIYKDLNNSPEGELISWYNVQSYGEFTFDIYNAIVNNGYTPNKVVFGMLGDSFNSTTMLDASSEIAKIKTKYPLMAGSIMWEYGDTTINPIEWAISI